MGRCQQKNVWLFVNAMSMAGSPSFGKTLFTHTLHNILNERSIENFDPAAIVLFWFLLFLSPVLNTKNYAKTCNHSDIFSRDSPSRRSFPLTFLSILCHRI
jgi:hypothetical protein